MSRITSIAALLILACAIVFAAYLAYAEAEFRMGTPESVARAVELRPTNTRYLSLRALQLDYDGADSVPLLERIAALNPSSSAPRIRLGLAAESRGDFVAAEHWLLSAARVDRQFEPSWTLANFYFRQVSFRDDRRDDFWTWMRQALEVSYGDRRPAFDLCWRMAREPREVLDRAIPQQPPVASAYLYYLLEKHNGPTETGALEDASLRLTGIVLKYDANAPYAICDLLIDRGRSDAARTLWILLGNPDLSGIVNGGFRDVEGPARGRGFEWRMEGGAGVVHLPLDGGGHRIALSGKQPELASLLRQIVYLEPGKRYTLRWKSRTTGIAAPTGLRWSTGPAGGPVESSNDWRDGSVPFTAATVLTPVALVYQRPSGMPRAEGSVDVTSLSITAVSTTEAAGATSSAK